MSGGLDYIRRTYKVPAKRGGLIRFDYPADAPQFYRIRSAHNGRLCCSVDGASSRNRKRLFFHPTWMVTYLSPDDNGA